MRGRCCRCSRGSKLSELVTAMSPRHDVLTAVLLSALASAGTNDLRISPVFEGDDALRGQPPFLVSASSVREANLKLREDAIYWASAPAAVRDILQELMDACYQSGDAVDTGLHVEMEGDCGVEWLQNRAEPISAFVSDSIRKATGTPRVACSSSRFWVKCNNT